MNPSNILEMFGTPADIADAARTIWAHTDGLNDLSISPDGIATLTRGDLRMVIGEDLGAGTSTDPDDDGYEWGYSYTITNPDNDVEDYGAGDTMDDALRAMHAFATSQHQ